MYLDMGYYGPGYEDWRQGNLGLAPRDASSGPLLLEYLYEQNSIEAKQFAIFLAPKESQQSLLTLGGFNQQDETLYDSKKFNFTATRVSGSFHWEVKLNKIGFMGT